MTCTCGHDKKRHADGVCLILGCNCREFEEDGESFYDEPRDDDERSSVDYHGNYAEWASRTPG